MGEEIALLCLTSTLVTTNEEAEIKIQEAVLHTRIWKGQSNFSLESFIPAQERLRINGSLC
jgi:hypothetical protein